MNKIMFVFLMAFIFLSGCTSQVNDSEHPKPNTASAKVIDLNFSPALINELKSGQPQKDWIKVKSIAFGKLQVHLYVDANNRKPYHTGSVYAFIQNQGLLYELGDVSSSYGLDDVEAEQINKKFGEQGLMIMGSIGTPYTEMNLIGYDPAKGRLLSILALGKPTFVDLDGDGKDELVTAFQGVHLNEPNINIFRERNGIIERCDVAEATGNEYAKLLSEGGTAMLETGKLNEEPHYYHYKDGKLIEL
ncbi:hypothetical protein PASE110613_08800 [Paenibacillus sediminis]|uniref:VCBS repeat-containing protein n=1 Tax=Paenibacillus sediminis TaxID=664909 RepID=A0ABS4H6D5_9BACL|nr:hypothetical protein [Paenibacillus sediminis]MBP1938093.1 hypothetical protein [Paenibacillus sediminis]